MISGPIIPNTLKNLRDLLVHLRMAANRLLLHALIVLQTPANPNRNGRSTTGNQIESRRVLRNLDRRMHRQDVECRNDLHTFSDRGRCGKKRHHIDARSNDSLAT